MIIMNIINYKRPFVCQQQTTQNTQQIWYILLL